MNFVTDTIFKFYLNLTSIVNYTSDSNISIIYLIESFSLYINNINFYFESWSTLISFSLVNMISHTLIKIIIFTLKFLILISLLIFVRGGLPRYRYDFLTKIGWLKLLSLTIAFFLTTFFLVYLFL